MKQVLLSFVVFLFLAEMAAANTASVKLGSMEVFPLLDRQGESPVSLLVGATEEQLARYAPSGTVNSQILAFLVKLPNRNILFDTGLGVAKGGKMMDVLQSLNVAPSDIDAILLTHLHPDHFGGLVGGDGKAAFPRAEVYVSRVEKDWWLNEREDENVRKALELCEGRLHTFEFGESPLSGVTALDTSGHTPGHTAFHIQAGEGELLVIGDALHFAEVQLPLPQIAVKYDVDQEKAPKARKYILDRAAEENIPVAGMHCPVPGLWRISKSGSGYEKSPLE